MAAAIDVLGAILAGAAAEPALSRWSRASRFAGAKDRAAIRDHVFDALRRLRSAAWLGGEGEAAPAAMDPRAVLAGLLMQDGIDPDTIFTGEGHAPAPFARPGPTEDMPPAVRLDMPDWLLPRFGDSLGEKRDPVLALLRSRAPIFLRANLRRISRADLVAELARAGIESCPGPLSGTALQVASGTRGLAATDAFAGGLFELQDAGSQALVDRLPLADGMRLLDLCAGGGGKSLAAAARVDAEIVAHDIDPKRMNDIPVRARRAGARIALAANPEKHGPFDGVIVDAPCSGSGSWRRAPEAKWRLTPQRLAELRETQAEVLRRACDLVRPGGWIAYMTCSLLREENAAIADGELVRRPEFRLRDRWDCTPLDGGDGFHLSLLEHMG